MHAVLMLEKDEDIQTDTRPMHYAYRCVCGQRNNLLHAIVLILLAHVK